MKDESEIKLVKEILKKTRNIAVIGAKKSDFEAAYGIPQYMFEKGYNIYPVNPKLAGEILFGGKVVSCVTDIEDVIDLVNIFRRSEFVYGHAEEILKMKNKPKYAWLQEGIIDDDAAKLLESNGIKVIQDRCIMIDHERLM
jgi:predicted CoA-binding protein